MESSSVVAPTATSPSLNASARFVYSCGGVIRHVLSEPIWHGRQFPRHVVSFGESDSSHIPADAHVRIWYTDFASLTPSFRVPTTHERPHEPPTNAAAGLSLAIAAAHFGTLRIVSRRPAPGVRSSSQPSRRDVHDDTCSPSPGPDDERAGATHCLPHATEHEA
jgi:hypothetical protein